MTQETGIATTQNAFSELANFNLSDAMSQELEGLSLSFERIKIPSAGSTVFELPGEEDGEPETVKEFTGVILYHHPLFAYYRDKYAGGNEPPDCGSGRSPAVKGLNKSGVFPPFFGDAHRIAGIRVAAIVNKRG